MGLVGWLLGIALGGRGVCRPLTGTIYLMGFIKHFIARGQRLVTRHLSLVKPLKSKS